MAGRTPHWGLVQDQCNTYTVTEGWNTPLRGVSPELAHDYVAHRFQVGEKVIRMRQDGSSSDVSREFEPPRPWLARLGLMSRSSL
jgi:hypothetical protein